MNNMPMISVIMPVYNSEKYLKESIESILNQTYKNLEFIIIDDGSTDNSLKIIQEYKLVDNRIKVITRENKGLIFSLNEGIALANGQYIARMDSDDISLSRRLEKQIRFLDERKDIDIVATHISAFGDASLEIKEQIERRYNLFINESNMEIKIFDDIPICHPSVMMRKSVLEQLQGYSNKYPCAEDYDLWMRALKQDFKLTTISEKLTKYRLHDNSKSFKDNKYNQTLIEYINIRLDYLEKYIKKEQINCYIWGASNGGNIVKEVLKQRFNNVKINGFIDKYKVGKLDDMLIYSPDSLKSKDISNYIFIGTTPGKIEAENFLKSLKYSEFYHFASLV